MIRGKTAAVLEAGRRAGRLSPATPDAREDPHSLLQSHCLRKDTPPREGFVMRPGWCCGAGSHSGNLYLWLSVEASGES